MTTLLDTAKYPAEELTSLYAQRWEIELKLRDIRTTLGMERFAVRTPDMTASSTAIPSSQGVGADAAR